MLSKRTVTWILAVQLFAVWSAVAVRIDRFPLTWAPMYAIYRGAKTSTSNASVQKEREEKRRAETSYGDEAAASSMDPATTPEAKRIKRTFRLQDKKRLEKNGWVATRRDGSTLNINRRDINVPSRSMRDLYYLRTFGEAPFNYRQLNYDAGTWDRWLWGLEPGEEYISYDWRRRLLVSINKTFGLRPEDSQFIVSLPAYYDSTLVYDDGSTSVQERSHEAAARWNDAWTVERW